jgi:hypothetical protein
VRAPFPGASGGTGAVVPLVHAWCVIGPCAKRCSESVTSTGSVSKLPATPGFVDYRTLRRDRASRAEPKSRAGMRRGRSDDEQERKQGVLRFDGRESDAGAHRAAADAPLRPIRSELSTAATTATVREHERLADVARRARVNVSGGRTGPCRPASRRRSGASRR